LSIIYLRFEYALKALQLHHSTQLHLVVASFFDACSDF
jgi:hypothetical protein